jgi:hypothetical protein
LFFDNRKDSMRSWKKTLLGGFAQEEDESSSKDTPVDETAPPRPVTRPTQASSTAINPLMALRKGPTASIFTRTTGLPAMTALSSSPIPPAAHVVVDHEFDEVISEALEQDAKAPGFKEFMAQLAALSNIIPDRGQCVKAALAAMTAINPSFNGTVVTRAIGERLKLLSGYETAYDVDSRKSESAETNDKSSVISEIDTRMRDIEVELQRLAGERAQCEQQRAQLDSELQGISSKYDGYRARLNGTVDARRAELKSLLNAVAPGAAEKEN